MKKDSIKKSKIQGSDLKDRSPGFNFEPFVGIEEIQELLKVPKKTVYKWTSESRINGFPYYKIGRHLKFRISQVYRWADKYCSSDGVKEFPVHTISNNPTN